MRVPSGALSSSVTSLQSLVEVLTTQTSQITSECNRLEEENNELKQFLEDVENESDLKSLLGALFPFSSTHRGHAPSSSRPSSHRGATDGRRRRGAQAT